VKLHSLAKAMADAGSCFVTYNIITSRFYSHCSDNYFQINPF